MVRSFGPATGKGSLLPEYKRPFTIEVCDEHGNVVYAYHLSNCWVTGYSAVPSADTSTSEVTIEHLRLGSSNGCGNPRRSSDCRGAGAPPESPAPPGRNAGSPALTRSHNRPAVQCRSLLCRGGQQRLHPDQEPSLPDIGKGFKTIADRLCWNIGCHEILLPQSGGVMISRSAPADKQQED